MVVFISIHSFYVAVSFLFRECCVHFRVAEEHWIDQLLKKRTHLCCKLHTYVEEKERSKKKNNDRVCAQPEKMNVERESKKI